MLYLVPVVNNSLKTPLFIGSYFNSVPIIRIGFLTTSILFYFDLNKEVKCINTRIIKIEGTDQEEQSIHGKKKEKKHQGLKGKVFSLDIMNQKISSGPKHIEIKLYSNFLVYFPMNFFVLGSETFYHSKLQTWEECFDYLKAIRNWSTLFSLGINLIKGSFTGLADVPEEDYLKVPRITHVLMEILQKYIEINLNKEGKPEFGFIDIAIEFCLRIKSVESLLKDNQKYFEKKKLLSFFFQKFEPYILSDRLKDTKMEFSTVSNFINSYINEKKFFKLSQMLPHFNVDSLSNDAIINTCQVYKLIDPLIYISMNAENSNLFLPIPVIFSEFILKQPFETKKSRLERNYNKNNQSSQTHHSFYKENKKLVNDNESLESTKEFLGHKLLWYIDLVLQGVRFPGLKERIPVDKGTDYVLIKIFLWLVSYKVARNLIAFDSFTYFQTMLKFFKNTETLNLVLNISKDTFNRVVKEEKLSYVLEEQSEIPAISDGDIIKILGMIQQIVELNPNFLIKQDFNEFIVKISTKVPLSNESIMDSLTNILSYHSELVNNRGIKDLDDKFSCHYRMMTFNQQYIFDLSDDINEVINFISTFKKDFKDHFSG